MKTTILLMSLGFLGYTLYNKFFRSNMSSAIAGIGDQSINSGGRQVRTHFDKAVEAQAERGEGLTDESKTGIED